jgi:hypothetical protein
LSNAASTNGQKQMFKSFQMAYLTHKFKQTKFSALFFKDDFSKFRIDSLGNATAGYVYGRRYDQTGVNSRMTYGAMLTGQFGNASAKLGKVAWQASALVLDMKYYLEMMALRQKQVKQVVSTHFMAHRTNIGVIWITST